MEWIYEKDRIYSMDENKKIISEVIFKENGKREISINHVYVVPEKRGTGIGSETMKVMAQYLRDEHMQATATCSYANTWLKENKENYSDVILDKIYDEAVACRIATYNPYIR